VAQAGFSRVTFPSVRARPGFGDFLGLREKAFLHVIPVGRLAPRRSSFKLA
jgi:hypothetical protein